MQTCTSDPAGEETSMSPSLDMMEEVEVWHQVLTQYLTEELNSFKSALGAFKQDLQHNLDELRAELSSHIRQELQKMRDNLERKFVSDLSSLYETHHSGMKVMEERITSMGECLSTRLQALEQKGGELAGAGTSPLLQHQTAQQIGNDQRPAGAPTSPVDPGAFPSSSPLPASPQPLTVGAPPLQTGPSADMLERVFGKRGVPAGGRSRCSTAAGRNRYTLQFILIVPADQPRHYTSTMHLPGKGRSQPE